MKGQNKGSRHAQSSCSNVDPQKKNRFYALLSRGEQDPFPDMVTGMLKFFSVEVYVFLDPDATLSFVTPLIAKTF